jgi:hypothetical protein
MLKSQRSRSTKLSTNVSYWSSKRELILVLFLHHNSLVNEKLQILGPRIHAGSTAGLLYSKTTIAPDELF